MKTEKRAVVIKVGFSSYLVAIYHITNAFPDDGSMLSEPVYHTFSTPAEAKAFIDHHFSEVVEVIYKNLAEVLDDLSPWNYFKF